MVIQMANISLNSASLLDAARKIEDAANRIDGAISRIDNIMSDLDAVWSDQNSKKYLERYEELKQEFPGFKSAVHSYSAFLNAVVATYQKEYLDDVSTTVN